MKKTILFIAVLTTGILASNAQVQVDHPIILTGSGPDAKVSGIQNVTGSQDAVSADYIQRDSLKFAIATGSGNTYEVALSPSLTTQYTVGMTVFFKANFPNTGAATLNVNSLGDRPIKKNYTSDLASNDIKSGQMVSVMYDGTNFQMLSQLGNSGGAPTCPSVSPQFLAMLQVVTNATVSSNTTGFTEAVSLPCTITVNQISMMVFTVQSAGAVKVGVYSEDGQTLLLSATSSTISGTGTQSIPVSNVTLPAGVYYFVMVPVGGTNISFRGGFCNVCPTPAGKSVYIGTQTVPADSLPATFDPTALSGIFYEVFYQLDN